jgi:hypothetical protein
VGEAGTFEDFVGALVGTLPSFFVGAMVDGEVAFDGASVGLSTKGLFVGYNVSGISGGSLLSGS